MASSSLLFLILCASNAETTILWSSTWTSNNELSWNTNQGQFVKDIKHCPVSDFCIALWQHNDLWRYNSTIGFHTITVHYTVRANGLKENEYCALSYIFERTIYFEDWSEWFIADKIQTNDITIMRNITIPNAENKSIVGIDFWIYTHDNNSSCYYNNLFMTGIPYNISPSNYPTQFPI
eukprot:446624_1